MSNFSTPQKVLQTIRAGDTTNFSRSANRLKITNAANGRPPLTMEDADKMGIKINVNWGELASLLAHARRQYYNAMIEGERSFTVHLPLAPEQFCKSWENIITAEANKVVKGSLEWFDTHQWRWTDVVVHGAATVLWTNADDWRPRFVAREDLRIPTDTYTSLTNLDWFAERHSYTVGELVTRVFGDNTVEGWNQKAVARILKNYREINYDSPTTSMDWETQPEKLAELVKQNLGYFESDAVPTIPLFSFYFKDTDGKLYHRVLPDTPAVRSAESENDTFLYTSDDPEADNINQLVHCQFGDLSFSTPFRFHSVRSLGFELLEPCFYTNLTRCRMLQHLHESFNVWIQLADPSDKDRAQDIDFSGPVARIPPGVQVMTQQQRHQVDPNLVEMALAQLKQLMQEASATYTQQTDTGTKKEETAFEVGVKVQQVNAMLSGLLMVAFTREAFLDREICRRLCKTDTSDADAKSFQAACERQGVPKEMMDVSRWQVDHVRPLGAGNPTLEQVKANQILQLRQFANPTAQQEMFHDALTIIADPKRADRWAPTDGSKRVTDAQLQAQSDFGSLMWGSPVPLRDELNPMEQIEVLLNKMGGICQRIQQTGNSTDMAELIGLQTVGQHIAQLIQRLAQNPAEKQRVRAYSDALGKLMNLVKGFAQRMQEQQKQAAQKQGNGNGDSGKLKATMLKAAVDARLQEQKHRQKMQHEEQEFQHGQRRSDAETYAQIQRDDVASRMKAFNDPGETE